MLSLSCSMENVTAAAQQVHAAVGSSGVQLLMNNAGVGVVAPVEHLPMTEFRQELWHTAAEACALVSAVCWLHSLWQYHG